MKRQPSVQDISWFIDLANRDQLDLNPPYQRRSVWTSSDRKYFLDTIFRNYPCPPIFIHKTIDDSGVTTYHIVDGKQRIETILLFAKNRIAMGKDFGDERINGLRFNKMDQKIKKTFWNYNVPVDFMDIDGLDINEVFDRVNRNSRNLERQELRHARYGGWFIIESEKEADEDEFWEKIKVTTKAKSKRMKNVQLVSELLLILIEEKIVGFSQDFLDEKYAEYDSIEDDENEGEFILDLESYTKKKFRVKSFLDSMEEHNSCITEYAKTNYHLYTLFALLSLREITQEASLMADKYKKFIELVDKFRVAEDPEILYSSETEKENWDLAYKYYQNTRGANTDLPQRKERLEALEAALL